jgi:predicted transcriptional regulator
MSTEADRTYINLMIIRTLAVTKGRTSVHQIHKSIEPKMGISVRSLQRYMKHLEEWGLVRGDGENPQGFSLTLKAKELINDMAQGASA